MTTQTKVNILDEITINEFEKMVRNNKFKVEEVSYSELIDRKNRAVMLYGETKKKADRYNIRKLSAVFTDLVEEHQEIIDIHTYLERYMNIVKEGIKKDKNISKLCREEQNVYRDIMHLRGYSSYKSNLAELSFALLCKKKLSDQYEVVFMNDKTDEILAVDVVLLSKHDDTATYVHITKDTPFSHDKLKKKSGKEVTVIDKRIKLEFLAEKQYGRRFKDHVLGLYCDKEINNEVVNGCYLYKEDYVKNLVEENKGKCDKSQYEELQYLEKSNKQVRKFGNKTITWYE